MWYRYCRAASFKLWIATLSRIAWSSVIDCMMSFQPPQSQEVFHHFFLLQSFGNNILTAGGRAQRTKELHANHGCQYVALQYAPQYFKAVISSRIRKKRNIKPAGSKGILLELILSKCSHPPRTLKQIWHARPQFPCSFRSFIASYWQEESVWEYYAAGQYDSDRRFCLNFSLFASHPGQISHCLHPWPLAPSSSSSTTTARRWNDVILYCQKLRYLELVARRSISLRDSGISFLNCNAVADILLQQQRVRGERYNI